MDDIITFTDDEPEEAICDFWTILVVDDDQDVHGATVHALQNAVINDRKIHFIHAYSGAEARKIVEERDDINLMLLDAVMEHPNAGLECACYCKETLGKTIPIIVMRTGFAGDVTEHNIDKYCCLDGYISKAHASREKVIQILEKFLR